jgi:glycosyltransferase involved in cell wall biosynthesis
MKIVLFSHPLFLEHQSMPRYANWLANGMKARGHEVSIIYPSAVTYKWKIFQKFKKWLGYIDQYILFPVNVKSKLRHMPNDTLFVFSDHALGPWVPIVANRKHIVHCHDFLAQKSAMGQIPQNPTGTFGKIYQQYIRNGFRQAKNFISISHKTQTDLHEFLGDDKPNISKVVYNGLNQKFDLQNVDECRNDVGSFINTNLSSGYFLHVGGNLWYKNRKGVLLIYDAWRKLNPLSQVKLLMLGAAPEDDLLSTYNNCTFKNNIHFVLGANDDLLKKAYCGAIMMLFPSIAEGFGWPIAEAMASGCPVLTTDAVPMSEVAGTAAVLINQSPNKNNEMLKWAGLAAQKIDLVLSSEDATNNLISKGYENVKRFDSDKALDAIEDIYIQVYNN